MNRQSLLGRFLRNSIIGSILPADVDPLPQEGNGSLIGPGAATTTPQAAPSGWDFAASMGKDFANSALPGIFNGQGGFDPMNAARQQAYEPYFGQNGIFNVTPNGPWRR